MMCLTPRFIVSLLAFGEKQFFHNEAHMKLAHQVRQ